MRTPLWRQDWHRKGAGQLAPHWWRHGVRRSEWGHAPLREPSGNASKGGGAANGAERRAEPRAAKGGATLYKRRTARVCHWWGVRRWLVVGRESDRQVRSSLVNLSLSPSLGPALVARRAACRRRRRQEAQQSRLWGASLRVRVGNAGESSLTTPGARGQARPRKAVGSRRRDLPTVAPRGRG